MTKVQNQVLTKKGTKHLYIYLKLPFIKVFCILIMLNTNYDFTNHYNYKIYLYKYKNGYLKSKLNFTKFRRYIYQYLRCLENQLLESLR